MVKVAILRRTTILTRFIVVAVSIVHMPSRLIVWRSLRSPTIVGPLISTRFEWSIIARWPGAFASLKPAIIWSSRAGSLIVTWRSLAIVPVESLAIARRWALAIIAIKTALFARRSWTTVSIEPLAIARRRAVAWRRSLAIVAFETLAITRRWALAIIALKTALFARRARSTVSLEPLTIARWWAMAIIAIEPLSISRRWALAVVAFKPALFARGSWTTVSFDPLAIARWWALAIIPIESSFIARRRALAVVVIDPRLLTRTAIYGLNWRNDALNFLVLIGVKITLRVESTLTALFLRLPLATRRRSSTLVALKHPWFTWTSWSRWKLSALRCARSAILALRLLSLDYDFSIASLRGILFSKFHVYCLEEGLLFTCGEIAPQSQWDPRDHQWPNANPRQPVNHDTGRIHHPADDVIHPFV